MPNKPNYEELKQRVLELENAEKALQRKVERWESLSQNAPNFVTIVDRDHLIEYINHPVPGLDLKNVIGHSVYDFIETAYHDIARKKIEEVFSSGKPCNYESLATGPEGTLAYYENQLGPIISEDEIIAVSIFGSDITKGKLVEDKLRKSHRVIEGILDTVPVRIFWKDQDLLYLGCNKLFARDAGFDDPKDMIGKDDYQMGWRDQAELYRNDDLEVIESGEAKYLIEEPQTTPEGNTITLLTSKTPLRSETGEIIGVLGTYLDITGRKQADNALKQNEQRYRSAQRMGQVGNWEYDLSMEEFWGSDEAKRIYGFDPESKNFTTDEVENCIPDRERVHQALLDLIEKGKPYDLEFEIRPITGPDKKFVKSIAELVYDESGMPAKVIGVVHDITQQKKAENEKIGLERQLKQSQKLESIGNLAGGIAHDFNNILSSIIGFTELALDDVPKGTPLEDNLQEVYTGGKRAKNLVKQILAFARQSDEERKPIKVNTIVKEVMKLMRSTIPTSIEIKENIESDSLIMGNPSQVHQLLMNLCTNAAQAMEDAGGILEVKLMDVERNEQSTPPLLKLKSGNYMKITVSDTGNGIPQGLLDSIFEPYFTTKDVGKGTGMGLALVHGIVESYGGEITVESELRKGAIFSIYLPITKKREDQRSYKKEKLPTGTERILFIDDEWPIAKMGSQILERLGYQVTVRTSSVEALELFRSKPNEFDLVLSDMMMPNMTGDELAMELIALRSDIPVILCTGYSKKITEEKAANIGIKAFAYKPVVKAELAKTVRKVLDEALGTDK